LVPESVQNNPNIAVFRVDIPSYFPLPSKGDIEVTSGLWNVVAPYEIYTKPGVVDVSSRQGQVIVNSLRRGNGALMSGVPADDVRSAKQPMPLDAIFGDTETTQDVFERNVQPDKGVQHIVVMKAEQVLSLLGAGSSSADIFVQEINAYLGFGAFDNGNRLIIYVPGHTFRETRSQVQNAMRRAGVAEGLIELFIAYEPASSVNDVVRAVYDDMQQRRAVPDGRHMVVFIDERDVLSVAVKQIRFDPRIPGVLSLGFGLSHDQLFVRLKSLASLAFNGDIVSVNENVLSAIRNEEHRTQVRIAA
jgi:hypothetical protein